MKIVTQTPEKVETLADRDERREPEPFPTRYEIGGREVSEAEFFREVERRDERRRDATRAHYAAHARAARTSPRVVRRAVRRAPRRARVAARVVRVDADAGDGPPHGPCTSRSAVRS